MFDEFYVTSPFVARFLRATKGDRIIIDTQDLCLDVSNAKWMRRLPQVIEAFQATKGVAAVEVLTQGPSGQGRRFILSIKGKDSINFVVRTLQETQDPYTEKPVLSDEDAGRIRNGRKLPPGFNPFSATADYKM